MRSLFIVCVIDILGFGILIPLVPYMADRFGASPSVITPILGAYSLCQLIAAPFWGRLSDRFGRRPILMTSLSVACVSYVILGFADNLWWLLVSRMLAGFMAGNLSAAFAYASDISTPENRAKALGTVGAAIGVGFMFGPAIGGLLAGNNEHTANFALPALVSSSLSLFAIALVFFMLPESHTAEHRSQRSDSRTHPFRLLREPHFTQARREHAHEPTLHANGNERHAEQHDTDVTRPEPKEIVGPDREDRLEDGLRERHE